MGDLYLDTTTRELSLETLKRMIVAKGGKRLYYKRLSSNDNSKNQLYLGGTAEDTRPIPTGTWEKELGRSGKKSPAEQRYILQAPVRLSWLDSDGNVSPAPQTKLILYPQYGATGEFRLSGFLIGAKNRPSTLLNGTRGREQGRIMFFAVDDSGHVLAFVSPADSRIAREVETEPALEKIGVLEEISLPLAVSPIATREEMLAALGIVHRLGWTDSKILNSKSGIRGCNGPQCVGQTLLAELGIPADGRAIADYRGWEVKAFTVSTFASVASCRVTLMTPEPTGGYYGEKGVVAFLAKYGTATANDPKKIYFEGQHRIGVRNLKRKTLLTLAGYDTTKQAITDASGGIRLIDERGDLAAEWGFDQLIEHWRNKHARAVFVPALSQKGPPQLYCYGSKVHLAVGNPFSRLMDALVAGLVIYDPGVRIDMSKRNGKGETKARSQFRITVPKCLAAVYEHVELLAKVG